MLSQFAYGAGLIALTVILHGLFLDLINKLWRAVSIEVKARWRAFTLSLAVVGIFIAHIIQIWVWAIFYYTVDEAFAETQAS